jgi:hypothetical protein
MLSAQGRYYIKYTVHMAKQLYSQASLNSLGPGPVAPHKMVTSFVPMAGACGRPVATMAAKRASSIGGIDICIAERRKLGRNLIRNSHSKAVNPLAALEAVSRLSDTCSAQRRPATNCNLVGAPKALGWGCDQCSTHISMQLICKASCSALLECSCKRVQAESLQPVPLPASEIIELRDSDTQ